MTEMNKALEAKQAQEIANSQAEIVAKKQGISVEEALQKLQNAGVVDVKTNDVISDSGKDSKQDYLVLQDNLDQATIKDLLDNLSTFMDSNPVQASEMLASWSNKAQKAVNSTLRSAVKYAVSK